MYLQIGISAVAAHTLAYSSFMFVNAMSRSQASLPRMLLRPTLSLSFSFFRSSGESDAFRMNLSGVSGLPGPRDNGCIDEVERDKLLIEEDVDKFVLCPLSRGVEIGSVSSSLPTGCRSGVTDVELDTAVSGVTMLSAKWSARNLSVGISPFRHVVVANDNHFDSSTHPPPTRTITV